MGDLLIAWTIRLALVCFLLALILWAVDGWYRAKIETDERPKAGGTLFGCTRRQRQIGARWLWTVGFIFFLGHVLAAFQFHFSWSQQRAFSETARQTRELLGVDFASGLLFNYFFLIAWLIDLTVLWGGKPRSKPRGKPRSKAGQSADAANQAEPKVWPQWYKWPRRLIIAYLLFIAFNGTVVFKSGWLRWTGVAACLLLLLVCLPSFRRKRVSDCDENNLPP